MRSTGLAASCRSMQNHETNLRMILGALADDLTGGLELAAMLVSEGVPTRLATSADGIGRVRPESAVVIAQKTRVAPVAEARMRFKSAARALRAAGATRLFFKYCATFDSTPSGNIGPCIDELLALTGSDFTACCPTFPEYRRTVYQGHLFVGDRLMSESPKRHDPLTPMTDADLVRVLSPQTARRVGLVELQTVRGGADAIRQRCAALRQAGIACAIADAVDHRDLRHLAEATADWPVMTGGSSVAAHYPAVWRELGWLGAAAPDLGLPAVAGPGVVLAGSCADQTRAQLRRFAGAHPLLDLDVEAALQGKDVAGSAIAWAGERQPRGPVAIATSATPEAVQRLQAQWGVAQVAACCENLLGRIAVGLRDAGVRRFVIAGGETSGAVLQHLGIERVTVGPFAGPSLPLALDITDSRPPVILCLKSGKLGEIDAFEVALDRMTRGGAPAAAATTPGDLQ
jgi:3-dehydrotetronate 4-kinase